MKKIMFNDKYGLTRAVLDGRKTQTRRIACYWDNLDITSKDVQRWVRQNKVHPCKRVGMMEYTTAELRKAQSNQQDYFK